MAKDLRNANSFSEDLERRRTEAKTWPNMLALLTSVVSAAVPVYYGYLGVKGVVPVTGPIYLAAVSFIFLGAVVIAGIVWRNRQKVSLLSGAYWLSYILAVAWYALPQPIFTLLVLHFDESQLRWFLFTWCWVMPIHALVTLGIFTVLAYRPLLATKDPNKVYRHTLSLPVIMAVGIIVVAILGFIAGGSLLRVSSAFPWIEVWKLYVLGFISSLFLGILFYFAVEATMKPIRIRLEKFGVRPIVRKVYTRRIFISTSMISFGILLFMGMITLRVYQDVTAQDVMHIVSARMEELVSRGPLNNEAGISRSLLRISPNTKVLETKAEQDLFLANASQETISALDKGGNRLVVDRNTSEKIVQFFINPIDQQLIILVVPLSDYYQSVIDGMRVYGIASGVVLVLAIAVTWYFSSTLAGTLRSLSGAVRSARDSLQSFTYNTYTADELEELSRAFRYYINQSNELQEHLGEKVKQRTAALLKVEEEKRELEVSAAQQQAKLEHKQRQMAEDNAGKLEEKVRERTAALRDAIKHLQEIDKVKSEFISLASHQLRTPLTSLRWAQHALLEGSAGELTSDQKEIVQTTLDRTLYMMRLVNELLDVTKIEDQKYDLQPALTNAKDLIEQIAQEVAQSALHKEVKFNALVDPNIPHMTIDADKLKMAITNIADNAVKYTNKGGVVEFMAKRQGDLIIIKTKDSGVGIPKKDLYRTFSKFFRASNAISLHTSGSGLGLYIAKTIVEKHGGKIDLESEVNKGTTVTITIPVQQVVEEEIESDDVVGELGALKSLVDKDEESKE